MRERHESDIETTSVSEHLSSVADPLRRADHRLTQHHGRVGTISSISGPPARSDPGAARMAEFRLSKIGWDRIEP
jgi:hypothetical protein